MSLDKKNLSIAYSILISKIHELKYLANISGRDVFTFYRGADLSGLDISGQDLTGMNFEGANIKFSSFKEVAFDPGAFNGCQIDPSQRWMTDEYGFYVRDLLEFDPNEILLFCKVRPGIIDEFIRITDLNYTYFSEVSMVSQNALRKARSGSVVAFETAQKIFRFISNNIEGHDNSSIDSFKKKMKQPCIIYLYGGNNAKFKEISRERLESLLKFRKFKIDNSPESPWSDSRDTVEYLEWAEDYFKRTRDIP